MKNNLIDFPGYEIRALDAMKFANNKSYMDLKESRDGYRIDLFVSSHYLPLVFVNQNKNGSGESKVAKFEIEADYFSKIMKDKKAFDTLTDFLSQTSRNPFSESMYLALDDDEIEVKKADYQLPHGVGIKMGLKFKPEAILELVSCNRGLIKTDERVASIQNPTFYAYKKKHSLKRKNLIPLAINTAEHAEHGGIIEWRPTSEFSDIFYNHCNIQSFGKLPKVSENVMECMNELINPSSIEMSEFKIIPPVDIASRQEELYEYHPFISDSQLCHEGEDALKKSFPMAKRENIKKVKY